MSAITVRGVTLLPPCQVTAGQFRVIVPVMAGDLAPLPAAARAGDLVELRLDALAPLEEETLSTILLKTRDQIGPGKPLLATIRTAREGGLAPLPAEQYAALCRAVCRTGAADLLDVELSAGEQTACALRDAAHAAGMNGHLAKPIDMDEVVKVICRVLTGSDPMKKTLQNS